MKHVFSKSGNHEQFDEVVAKMRAHVADPARSTPEEKELVFKPLSGAQIQETLDLFEAEQEAQAQEKNIAARMIQKQVRKFLEKNSAHAAVASPFVFNLLASALSVRQAAQSESMDQEARVKSAVSIQKNARRKLAKNKVAKLKQIARFEKQEQLAREVLGLIGMESYFKTAKESFNEEALVAKRREESREVEARARTAIAAEKAAFDEMQRLAVVAKIAAEREAARQVPVASQQTPVMAAQPPITGVMPWEMGAGVAPQPQPVTVEPKQSIDWVKRAKDSEKTFSKPRLQAALEELKANLNVLTAEYKKRNEHRGCVISWFQHRGLSIFQSHYTSAREKAREAQHMCSEITRLEWMLKTGKDSGGLPIWCAGHASAKDRGSRLYNLHLRLKTLVTEVEKHKTPGVQPR